MACGRGLVLRQKAAHQLVQRRAVVQAAALRRGFHLADQAQQALGVALQQVKQDGLLGTVVVVQARLGRAAGRGNVVHAGGGIAFVGKAGGGAVQDFFAPELKSCRFGASHGRIIRVSLVF